MNFIHLAVAVLFIALFPHGHSLCNVTDLTLDKQSGFINSPPPVGSKNQDCSWDFQPRGKAIVLHIEEMNFILNYHTQYWWHSAQLTLEGHNINDFKKDACFIFLPEDDVTCDDAIKTETENCQAEITFSGNSTYPPTLSYKTLHLYYEEEHLFKIKYSYVPCKKKTTIPVIKPQRHTGAIMSYQNHNKKEINVHKNSGRIDPVVIVLGVLCGVLAVTVFLLVWRLYTTKREQKPVQMNESDRAQILL